MMARSRWFALFTLALASACQPKPASDGGPTSDGPAGDGGPRACTEMACSDAAVITATLSPAGAPLGTHAFALELDGQPETCTVEFTSETATAWGQCSGTTTLMFGPAMEGKETSMDGTVGYTEVPIPGEFRWQLTVQGTPTVVHVVHTNGDSTVVDQTATLTYAESRPNGPGCEPVCKAAEATWKGR